MKHYLLLWITGSVLMLATACNNSPYNNEHTDTTMLTLPVDTANPTTVPPDTAAVPRVDPALDSAARQMDDALPPK